MTKPTVCKILGAAAEEEYGFQEILGLGKATTGALSSIAATLEHAHVPGRAEHGRIPDDTIEIGLGLHNEPVNPDHHKHKDTIAYTLKGLFRCKTSTFK